jgi:thiol-disulfide isomerase/thioredoxin
MKKIVLAVFMAAMALSLSAQINFREGGFAEALEAAKSENKLVFMDCYTSWCGPCKLMASKEFVQEKAGEYFNPRFVSVKIDMEKGEGVELRKRYDVNAYPTLLVLNVKGELLCRHAGYLSVDELIDFAENGISIIRLMKEESIRRNGFGQKLYMYFVKMSMSGRKHIRS